MKKYIAPELLLVIVGKEDIMDGSDVDIDIGDAFEDESKDN